MYLLKIYCLLSIIPSLYTLDKLYYRKDLNVFDILILFSTLYFCIIPFNASIEEFTNHDIVNSAYLKMEIFLFYNLYAYTILIINCLWTRMNKSYYSIINITCFLRNQIRVANIGSLILFVSVLFLLFGWINYAYELKTKSEVLHFSYENMRTALKESKSYEDGAMQFILKTLINYFFCITTLYIFNLRHRGKEINRIVWLVFAGYFLLMLFGSRTRFVGNVFLIFLFYYSVNKNEIKFKSLIKVGLPLILIFSFVFNFVLVYRSTIRSVRDVSGKSTFENTVSIINLTVKNFFGSSDGVAVDKISSRSLAVFEAFSKSFNPNIQLGKGDLTLASVSIGIPKALFPGKSEFGSQFLIERELGINTDIADSFFLFNSIEWGNLIGGFACAILYFIIFYVWDKLNYNFRKVFSSYRFYFFLIDIYPLMTIIFLAQYIETSLDKAFSEIIKMPLIYLLLLFVLKISTLISKRTVYTKS